VVPGAEYDLVMTNRRVIEAAQLGQNPSEWAFSQGLLVGDRLFISGQVSPAPTFAEQIDEAFQRVIGVVEEAGGTVADLVALRIYTTEEGASAQLVAARLKHLVAPYPAVTLLRVAGFGRPQFLIEIEGEAIISG
jgi:2-iminobutanoate/2-iminopropanoate deaminase